MLRLFLPMRVIADCVLTVLGLIEISKNVKAMKKQTINSSNEK